MKCPNCGASIGSGTKFCPNCGNSVSSAKQSKVTIEEIKDNSLVKDIINFISTNPKLIICIVLVIFLIGGVNSIFNHEDSDINSNGSSDTIVYGMNFHVPDGYVETKRADFTDGEYADFKKNGHIIEISVSDDITFKESKYIEGKVHKTVNNKDGTLYTYKVSKRMAYVYFEDGKRVVIRDATSKELEEIII